MPLTLEMGKFGLSHGAGVGNPNWGFFTSICGLGSPQTVNGLASSDLPLGWGTPEAVCRRAILFTPFGTEGSADPGDALTASFAGGLLRGACDSLPAVLDDCCYWGATDLSERPSSSSACSSSSTNSSSGSIIACLPRCKGIPHHPRVSLLSPGPVCPAPPVSACFHWVGRGPRDSQGQVLRSWVLTHLPRVSLLSLGLVQPWDPFQHA